MHGFAEWAAPTDMKNPDLTKSASPACNRKKSMSATGWRTDERQQRTRMFLLLFHVALTHHVRFTGTQCRAGVMEDRLGLPHAIHQKVKVMRVVEGIS